MTAGESIMLTDDEAATVALRLVAKHVRDRVEMLPEWEDVPLLDERSWRRVAAMFPRAADALDDIADGIDAICQVDSRAILEACRD